MTHIELHSSTELYPYYTRVLSDFKSLFVFFPFFHVMHLFFALSHAVLIQCPFWHEISLIRLVFTAPASETAQGIFLEKCTK